MSSMFSGSWSPPKYTNLITSEHADKPKFMAMIALTVQPFIDQQTVLQSMPSLFDLDDAVGSQLDDTGEWIGQSRNLEIPLTGVYFGFGLQGQGWGQGVWRGPFDPVEGLTSLSDTDYRTLLKARVANNRWDGTIPGAYSFMDPLFPNSLFFIQDNGDMSMYEGLMGSDEFNAVLFALFTQGYLKTKPLGVNIRGYVIPSVPATPLFGFGVENSTISGFGVGAWPTIIGDN